MCDDFAGGEGTFQNCSSLEEITIPAGSTYVGRDVFAGCSSLTSITIPETVTGIVHGAFSGCSNLTTIDIPAAVVSIGQGAFSNCTKLQTVTFHESSHELEIDAMAFANCTSLKSITLPAGVKNCYEAFYGCTSLETVVLPDTFEYIAFEMFKNCSSLNSITIPDTVTEIGQYAFKGCTSLTAIEIPGTTKISEDAFETTTIITRRAVEQGNSTATITVNIEVDSLSTINVTYSESGNIYSFQAPKNYTSYQWKINGVDKGTTYRLNFNTSTYNNGIYDITLLASNIVDGKTIYYSYSAQITVTQE